MKKLIKNNKGFTLAELMIAGGIAGVIGLVAVTSLKNTKQASNITVVASEVSTLKSLIVAQLNSPSGCRKTFPPGTPITRPTNVEIISPAGAVIAKAGSTFGPTREFSISNIGTSSVATSNILKIKVDYVLKATLDRPGKKTYSFDVDLFVNKNDAKTEITACFLDITRGTKKAVEGSCRGLGAVYDATVLPYGSCTHNLPEVRNAAGVKMVTNLCPSGQYLQRVSAETAPVNKIILECRPFAVGPCGAWSYVNKVNGTTGVADCVSLSSLYAAGRIITTMNTTTPSYKAVNLNCPNADHVIRSIDVNGDAECIPKHIFTDCGDNEYVYDVTKVSATEFKVNCKPFVKTSAVACSGVNEFLQAVNADGTIPAGGCVAQTLPNASCPAGNVMTGINSSGFAICQPNPSP